jgi:hypothetical protein
MHANEFWSENLKGRDYSEYLWRWEGNIKMALEVVGWEGVYRIHLARDTDQWRFVANTVMNFRIP